MNLLQNTRKKRMLDRSLIIDPSILPSEQKRMDDGELLISDGARIALSDADKKKVLYSKFEPVNAQLTDVQHPSGEWRECGVSHHMVNLMGEEDREELGLTMDDGIMMWFLGTAEEEVAIDPVSRRVLKAEDAELEEELSGAQYPRFIRFDFRIEDAKITDGPERRISLHEDAEKQRARSESQTNDKLSRVLEGILDRLDKPTATAAPLSQDDALQNLLDSGMNVDQIKAAIELKAVESETVTASEIVEEPVAEGEEAVTFKKTRNRK